MKIRVRHYESGVRLVECDVLALIGMAMMRGAIRPVDAMIAPGTELVIEAEGSAAMVCDIVKVPVLVDESQWCLRAAAAGGVEFPEFDENGERVS